MPAVLGYADRQSLRAGEAIAFKVSCDGAQRYRAEIVRLIAPQVLPGPDAPEASALDVVVVPAVAADPTGHRIGYGAGYYDRTLPRYVPPAVSVIVAYDWQMVAEVPATEHDVRCQWVLTDVRTFDAR